MRVLRSLYHPSVLLATSISLISNSCLKYYFNEGSFSMNNGKYSSYILHLVSYQDLLLSLLTLHINHQDLSPLILHPNYNLSNCVYFYHIEYQNKPCQCYCLEDTSIKIFICNILSGPGIQSFSYKNSIPYWWF